MEVDATIQEDFVEDDVGYISTMRLAVSDDEDDGGADGGGCRVDTTTMTTRNRENGGANETASSSNNSKKKLLYGLQKSVVKEGERLYGFDEETGEPTYGPIEDEEKKNAVVEEKAEIVESGCVDESVVPRKKSRPSLENVENISQVSSSMSPSTSGAAAVTSNTPAPASTATSQVPAAQAPTATPTPSISFNKPKSTKDDFYKKPFEHGWKRELVYRANPETSKDKADVYFIAPSGKKLRSKNEIIPHLSHDLTIDNFCFAKEPLGVGAEFEIVRSAKPTHRSVTETVNATTSTSSGKRISKPKAPKGASPPPQGWTPTRALKNSSSLNMNSNSTGAATTSASPKTTPKSSKGRKIGDPQPCTMQCAPALGMVPQLQCIKCLCLYHHECVGLDKKDDQYRVTVASDGGAQGKYNYRKDYVCQSCIPPHTDTSLLKENQMALKEKQISMNMNVPNFPPPPPPPSAQAGPSTSIIPPQASNVSCVPSPAPRRRSSPPTRTGPSVVASVAVTSTQKPIIPTPQPVVGDLPQSIAVIKGKKYVVVKKPLIQRSRDSVATTSASASSSASASASASAAENNTTESSTENDVTSNDRSKRHNTYLLSNSHRKHSSTASSSGAAIGSTSTAVIQSSPPRSSNATHNQQTIRTADSSSSVSSLTFATNFFENVSVGYGAILHILKYLKIHERPRAASVCKIWNLVAKDRSLWQTVRMKNSKVSNWAGFTAALRRGETKHLDLRKLLVSSTRLEETWSEFCKHIGTVCSLEHIDMCRCSAQIVETLFLTNPKLKILSALAINDENLNLINIDNMVELQELRLRTLDKCNLEGDLLPLRSLQNLQHLSLSSVRELGNKQIEVIGELTNLISLELGECNDFDSRFTDNVLPRLSNLERLRLEIGHEQCCTLDILESVAKLENLSQLEFVNFDIKPGFDDKLAQCTNIRKLLIIPTYISQSATTNNIVLNAVLKLKKTLQVFTWGVTVELLRVTALYVDQCEDSARKERRHFDECIPVLKPVPGSTIPESSNQEPSTGANAVPQIEILPLEKVEEILRENLDTTKFTIVKVPYHATWKQQLVE